MRRPRLPPARRTERTPAPLRVRRQPERRARGSPGPLGPPPAPGTPRPRPRREEEEGGAGVEGEGGGQRIGPRRRFAMARVDDKAGEGPDRSASRRTRSLARPIQRLTDLRATWHDGLPVFGGRILIYRLLLSDTHQGLLTFICDFVCSVLL